MGFRARAAVGFRDGSLEGAVQNVSPEYSRAPKRPCSRGVAPLYPFAAVSHEHDHRPIARTHLPRSGASVTLVADSYGEADQ